jgi:hypothetical protein
MRDVVDNTLREDAAGVWVLEGHETFGYTDGRLSDVYLRRVLENATDLGSRSEELRKRIKGWQSEYHLTPKRSQLLSGFEFDRKARVLEIGGGCGAITRYLGETFDQVVSVEGEINRARIARMRTRDLPNVSIVCAPFQDTVFREKFDIVFCIGVLEYSGAFINGADPFNKVIDYFSDITTDGGSVVVAIENQFGLKYFSGADEDHLAVRFAGLEGYPATRQGVRTFGKFELEAMLKRRFANVEFYYPYPDYKVPDAVLSQKFLDSGLAGDLVAQIRSRNYSGDYRPLWREAAVASELNRNRALHFFSNSFLVFAGKSARRGRFDQLGVMFSTDRKERYATVTRIIAVGNGNVVAAKTPIHDAPDNPGAAIRLRATQSRWVSGSSIFTEVVKRAEVVSYALDEIFEPARIWVANLRETSTHQAPGAVVPATMIDNIWTNSFVRNGECHFIDQEWEWRAPVKLNTLVIRAIYHCLDKGADVFERRSGFSDRSGRKIITSIARAIGVELTDSDFADFVDIEAEIQADVFGVDPKITTRYLRLYLIDRKLLRFAASWRNHLASSARRVGQICRRASTQLFGVDLSGALRRRPTAGRDDFDRRDEPVRR